MEEMKVLSSPSCQDHGSDMEQPDGNAFIIKRPNSEPEENAVISVDVNGSN